METRERVIQACLREAAFDLVRSSGPGGQNVNKVSTAVQLRFDAGRSSHLSAEIKQRLLARAGKRASPAGVLVIQASRRRTQGQNRDDAIARFRALLEASFQAPKKRHPTKATAASKERRLRSKKKRSELKRTRGLTDG